MTDKKTNTDEVKALFEAGAHFGFRRTRRHPTIKGFLFGTKAGSDIFDIEKTAERLDKAKEFATTITKTGKKILFVGGKNEAQKIVREAAEKLDMPFVASRWIGGTLTNFSEIRKRTSRLERLRTDKTKGNLEKYTKKERLMIDREIEDLESMFGGISAVTELPAALFVVDPNHESKAIAEAVMKNIPIIALASSDCDIANVAYPIPANDATQKSIQYIVDQIVSAIATK